MPEKRAEGVLEVPNDRDDAVVAVDDVTIVRARHARPPTSRSDV